MSVIASSVARLDSEPLSPHTPPQLRPRGALCVRPRDRRLCFHARPPRRPSQLIPRGALHARCRPRGLPLRGTGAAVRPAFDPADPLRCTAPRSSAPRTRAGTRPWAFRPPASSCTLQRSGGTSLPALRSHPHRWPTSPLDLTSSHSRTTRRLATGPPRRSSMARRRPLRCRSPSLLSLGHLGGSMCRGRRAWRGPSLPCS